MDFSEVQQQFTRHMRDPEHCTPPADVEDRRMAIYRDLLYRNVEGFLANSFPVTRKVIPIDRWHAMIRDYFKRHVARTPLFPKMPMEFLQYLDQERGQQPDDFPFLRELARYEWAELEMSYDTREIDLQGINPDGDLLAGTPVLNPIILPLACRYPVHQISPENLPEAPPEQSTYLLIYRDRNDRVGFIELNPVTARLIELLRQDSDRTGRAVLEQISVELKHPDPGVVISGGHDTMQTMRGRDIILGTG